MSLYIIILIAFYIITLCNETEGVITFIEYFRDEWVNKRSNWFEGWNDQNNAGTPITNNGNEAVNGVFKAEDY